MIDRRLDVVSQVKRATIFAEDLRLKGDWKSYGQVLKDAWDNKDAWRVKYAESCGGALR